MRARRDDLELKSVEPGNWLERDPTLPPFVMYSGRTATEVQMGAQQWAEWILAPRLGTHVPVEVRRLFEVARGAMLYGFFFYPLYTVGLERLYLMLEAAITHRHREAGGPARTESGRQAGYADRIEWLCDNSLIEQTEREHWHAARSLRNLIAHQEDQMLQLPVEGLRALQSAVTDLDRLFPQP